MWSTDFTPTTFFIFLIVQILPDVEVFSGNRQSFLYIPHCPNPTLICITTKHNCKVLYIPHCPNPTGATGLLTIKGKYLYIPHCPNPTHCEEAFVKASFAALFSSLSKSYFTASSACFSVIVLYIPHCPNPTQFVVNLLTLTRLLYIPHCPNPTLCMQEYPN